MPIEALNWRVTVAAPPPVLAFGGSGAPGTPASALKARRQAWFTESQGWVDTPVYDRYALGPGTTFEGPAIIEERESTAIVGPGARCHVDEGRTIVVEMPA